MSGVIFKRFHVTATISQLRLMLSFFILLQHPDTGWYTFTNFKLTKRAFFSARHLHTRMIVVAIL